MNLYDLAASGLGSIARMYGYKKITPLINDNIGLLAVLIALVVGSFLLFRVAKTIPTQGRAPFRVAAFTLCIKFVIGAFVVVVLFAVFAEGKKIVKESRLIDERIYIHSTDFA